VTLGLVAVLSNIQTEALFQRLTRRDWRQVRQPPPRPRDRARDGKLKFGTVSGAVLTVLAQTGKPMRFIEIHASVEALLDTPVSRSSVKQFLSDEARHRKPRFVRLQRGLYQVSTEVRLHKPVFHGEAPDREASGDEQHEVSH
jgi:hypothetical protein